MELMWIAPIVLRIARTAPAQQLVLSAMMGII